MITKLDVLRIEYIMDNLERSNKDLLTALKYCKDFIDGYPSGNTIKETYAELEQYQHNLNNTIIRIINLYNAYREVLEDKN